MDKVALFNGEFIDSGDAKIGALSSAALFGRGIFTTVAIYHGRPFLFDKHVKRLRNNAAVTGLQITEGELDSLENQLTELIRQNSVTNGRARVTLFDSSASRMWSDVKGDKIESLVVTADPRPVPAEISLTVSPYSVNSASPLAGVKSCNYLENLLAKDEARSRGFDEAIRLNERGEVTSACMANTFWLNGDQLFTPSLATGCLAGTTRKYVLENLDCREVIVRVDELAGADAIFLTSAGIGIRQVRKLDERVFADSVHPLLDLLPGENKKTRMFADQLSKHPCVSDL
jgi:branched-subunit amino acid aminotransferase/4-amino-4-deoxychorismate lyase